MKKKLLLLQRQGLSLLLFTFFAFTLGLNGRGQTLLLNENFSYTAGTALTTNGWAISGSTATPVINVTASSITYPGYLSSGIGEEVSLAVSGQDLNQVFTAQTAGVLYTAFLVNVTTATTTGDYFFNLCTNPFSTSFYKARTFVKKDATNKLAFGISQGSTPVYTAYSYDLNVTYLLVVRYSIVTGTANDVASIYINPTLNAVEPASGWLSNTDIPVDPTNLGSVALRQGGASSGAALKLDGIRVSTSWEDIVGVSSAIVAPTVQASNISFANILQTQMNVLWSNGNGTKRIVKMNTTNSFSVPVDGTDPIANSAYSGGEQVVYNNSANTIPTITGLTAGTTYYFRVYEYNGSGTGTKYLTSTGTNNPNSQATVSGATAPLVSDPTSATITATSAILGGNITADGDSPITERGTVWKTSSGVTISDNKLAEGGVAIGVFTHLRTSFPANSTIYYAAYAVNSVGTTLSAEASFTTLLPEPTNHVANFNANSPNYSSIISNWTDNDGTQPASGFLILANTTGIFVDPVDGISQTNDANLSDGSGAINVNHGVQTYSWFSLNSSTQYYFTIYPYTNSGTNINYLTAPVVPTANTPTLVYVAPLAGWTFDATLPAPGTPTSVAANVGTGMLYADGTNGSSTWDPAIPNPAELAAFSGSTINDPREGTNVLAGLSYCPQGGTNMSANGKSMVLKFSMTNFQNPILTFATRGTATGFTTHQWAWSTDNIAYTDFGTNTANVTTSFILRTLDLSSINEVDQAANVYLRVTFTGAANASGNNRLDNIVINATASVPATKTLNLTAYLEGLYNTGTGKMNQAQKSGAPQFADGTADVLTVELHNVTTPFATAYSYTDINLSTSGNLSIGTIPAAVSGSYYIVLKHRNSVELWSATAVSFAGSTIDYNFSTSATQAYGSAMKNLGSGVFGMYAGDVNQDGIVDSGDMVVVDNDAANFVAGYVTNDVNGDGIINAADLLLLNGNATGFVGKKMP